MSENVNIVNYALRLLGAKRITSLEDEQKEAQVMKDMYDIARDAVLEEAEWTFATRRFLPAKETEDPEWGWANSFPVPSDIIRVTTVERLDISGVNIGTDMNRYPAPHEVEGRKILTNEDVIFCKGLRRIDDEGIYSPLFIEAFAMKLALVSCLTITESKSKLDAMAALYTSTIQKAKSRDGMQSSTRRFRSKTFGKARF